MHDDRSLDEIGLGANVQAVLYFMSVLPLVGLVIGFNYAVRRNAATRQLGRRLFMYASVLHLFYACCLCPVLILWAVNR